MPHAAACPWMMPRRHQHTRSHCIDERKGGKENKQASSKWRRASAKIAEALANDACEEQIVGLLSLVGSENMNVLLSRRDGGPTNQLES